MSVSVNRLLVEDLSKREGRAVKSAAASSTADKQVVKGSDPSGGFDKPLSAFEQTSALAARYAEAGLSVSVNFQTVDGHLVYIVKDSQTGDVIRQIPSEEALRISKHLDHLTGLMLDKSVE
jgi:flagellar protein FlaG